MEAIFFAFISFVGWGVGDFFVTIAARKLDAYSATFWTLLLSAVLFGFLIPFFISDLANLTPSLFGLNLFLGFIFIVGIISFREGLISGSAPIVVTISASYTVLTTILSIIFFKETLTFNQTLSIILIFIGLIFVSLNFNDLKDKKVVLNKGTVFALISMVIWGVYFTFIKIPVREIGWFWPNYISIAAFAPFVYLYIRFRKMKLEKATQNNALPYLLIAVILARVSEMSFNAGIERGYTSIVAPIAGANPVLFIVLSAIFLKDKVTKQQTLGIVITLAGIILLSIFSV